MQRCMLITLDLWNWQGMNGSCLAYSLVSWLSEQGKYIAGEVACVHGAFRVHADDELIDGIRSTANCGFGAGR